jgi:ferredoxin, 2Fe-2S
MYTVHVKFVQEKLNPVVLKNVEYGQTLLELLLANKIELDHECGGVCSCTTCHVYVEKGLRHIEEKSRREVDFINKKIDTRLISSRLSCQALILEGSGEIEIVIPDQTKE